MSELERALIDTLPFQRLRRIKQLATTFLVYHGAEHTRFGHSIGVMHLTSAVFDSEKALPVILKHQDEPVSILEESLLLDSLNKPIAFDRFYVTEEYKESVQAVIREYNDTDR
jgi:hypothetical protein